MSFNYLKIPYTHKNKLCNIINNERPSQMLSKQSTHEAPNLREYGRYITRKDIQDYKFKHEVNKYKISNLEFEEISLFSNYIVGVNIAQVAYLRGKMHYLPPELWLYIGSFMMLNLNSSSLVLGVIENRTNFYLEYNMSRVFTNNYNSLQNQYLTNIEIELISKTIEKEHIYISNY